MTSRVRRNVGPGRVQRDTSVLGEVPGSGNDPLDGFTQVDGRAFPGVPAFSQLAGETQVRGQSVEIDDVLERAFEQRRELAIVGLLRRLLERHLQRRNRSFEVVGNVAEVALEGPLPLLEAVGVCANACVGTVEDRRQLTELVGSRIRCGAVAFVRPYRAR